MRTIVRIAILAACLAALSGWAPPARAHEVAEPVVTGKPLLSAQDRKAYRTAFHKAAKERFLSARKLARKAKERLPAKVIRWMELAGDRPRGDFAEVARFLEDNPEWPRRAALLRNAELAMPDDLPDERLLAWFEARPPVTAAGAVRHAAALMRAGQKARATALLRATWVGGDFGRRDERAFRKRFSKLLRREDELARLDRLLWDRKYRPAKRQARRLGKAYAALAEARIALARRSPGVDWAVKQVPAELKDDPGLVYERARWRRRKNRYDGVIELLDPPDPAAPHPERWWPLRKWAARQALMKGDISVAYRMARAHGLEAGLGFAEGEWLAGWIALRFLDQPETAYRHFERLNEGVSSPISLARSAYWAGEAARDLGRRGTAGDWRSKARKWYRTAARFGTTFYGQLAAQRLDRPVEIESSAAKPPSAEARAAFDRRELVRVVRMLGELGEAKLHERFLLRLKVLAESAEDYALVADLAHEQGRSDIAMRTAKAARTAGFILFDDLFPSRRIPEAKDSEPALVLAVIRQESAFYKGAVSRAGARGLMQLMPRTAKRVARRIKVRYSRKKLLTDAEYNLRLGRAYLSGLTQDYDGSYVLALAAYNAGPARANRWIKAFGDPREADVDPIDWIESIPFDETRNYVQRILESLVVYRRHLGVPDADPLVPRAGTPFKSLAKSPELD
ncbi:MAG: lytic transglycosylase domain-containing protein [Proteobacteria bacterium]|nr:lytic transglycosylase domain-containing protein [Pseudomonadota bacterium]